MVTLGRPISGLPPFHAVANICPVLSQQFAPARVGGVLLGIPSDYVVRAPLSAFGPFQPGGNLLFFVESSLLAARSHGCALGLLQDGQKSPYFSVSFQ